MKNQPFALRAFHNDAEVKALYVARLKEHRRLEHLVQGQGYVAGQEYGGPSVTKGCAVGCTLNAYDHKRYPNELGLSIGMAVFEDFIFEGLPKGDAEDFAEAFLDVIPVGAYTSGVLDDLALKRNTLNALALKDDEDPFIHGCYLAISRIVYH